MSQPFIGEIKMTGVNFAQRSWAFCDGQILPINQNQSLFSLLGTTFGGDGRSSFALPDLRGRTAVHPGTGAGLPAVSWGQKSGSETVVLTEGQMPSHDHQVEATNDTSTSGDPTGRLLGKTSLDLGTCTAANNLVAMNPAQVGNVGGQSHDNMQPFLVVAFIIALQGLFPSRN